jgi:hypothetical protein
MYLVNFVGGGVKIRGYWMVVESAIPDSSTFDSAICDPKPGKDLLRSINFFAF